MCSTIILSEKDASENIELVSELRDFGVNEFYFVLDGAYESFSDNDCLCVLDLIKTFESAGLFLERVGAMEYLPICPMCKTVWTKTCFTHGCTCCGHIIETASR